MGCWSSPVDHDRSRFYRIGDLLDAGCAGEVYRAHDLRTNELVAIKYIPRHKVNTHVEREVLNFSRCQHGQIISFREVFLTPTHLAISMEFAEAGNLLDYLNKKGPLPENDARWLFQQLIAAVDHCHYLDIILRDIKPENTLLVSLPGRRRQRLKICDFGTSRTDTDGNLTKTSVGTPIYSAPEVLRNCCRDGKKADVWSAGVVLYCMVYNRHPFLSSAEAASGNFSSACRRVMDCKYEFPSQPSISPELKDLLRKILVKDPTERIAISEIYRLKWFRTGLPASYFSLIGKPVVAQTRSELKRWKEMLAAAKAS